jgi:hypothetical protein
VTPQEIAARLRPGGVALAFDTNALFGEGSLFAVCNDVARHNEHLATRGLLPVRLVVSTVAHTEKLFDLKQEFRDRFDGGVILRGLQRKGLVVQPFEAAHALATAQRLGERYPKSAEWHEAKRLRCLHCLGLSTATATPGTGKGCGATVDWLIGGHARAEGCVLVTNDTGPEFAGLVDRVKLDVLEAALHDILSEHV